jgi:hypothetical protein
METTLVRATFALDAALFDTIDHAVPLQRSTRAVVLPFFRLNPTAHNPVAGEPDTPSHSLSLPVTLGEGTTDQLEPSQCSTRVWRLPPFVGVV